ncbi:hypothetical protein [Hyphomicrobium sp. ghe19]|uniref:hypothetical protein n=1 Tax=Hyphomicrobium sp. ghe19 TaxID=2682968 RepID=UPI0013677070|nr:hypothetical protein HYPP_00103 [Hyphomicrobium sp. ghe19]
MSGGFCPHDWHGTTEADLQQESWGEDYDFWSDVAATTSRHVHKRQCTIHDAAIGQAKREGLTFHLLPDAEQYARLERAERSHH